MENEVYEVNIQDIHGTTYVLLARDENEADILAEDIEVHRSVMVRNVLIMKDGEVSGFVEDSIIVLTYLDISTLDIRKCQDDQPKFALPEL